MDFRSPTGVLPNYDVKLLRIHFDPGLAFLFAGENFYFVTEAEFTDYCATDFCVAI